MDEADTAWTGAFLGIEVQYQAQMPILNSTQQQLCLVCFFCKSEREQERATEREQEREREQAGEIGRERDREKIEQAYPSATQQHGPFSSGIDSIPALSNP